MSFLSTVLFSGEERDRAKAIAEQAKERQIFTYIQSKLNSNKLTAEEKDIKEALAQHRPLRHKDAHTVATHSVAHLIERCLTRKAEQENKKKRGRDDEEVDSEECEQGYGEDNAFPGPPPGSPPVVPSKKRRTETGSSSVPVKTLPRPPPVPSTSRKPQQEEKIPTEVIELIEKRPENYIMKIFKSLQIPPNNTMASLLNQLIIALHDRNGGNSMTASERKRLSTSVCEYLFATRYRSTDVNAATASAKKTIHEQLSNQVLTSNQNPTHDEVEKLLNSLDSLFECWNHLNEMVRTRRGSKGMPHPALRRKHEESVASIVAERSRMQGVIEESSVTIQKSKLRMHSLDTFIDKYVPGDEEDKDMTAETIHQTSQAKIQSKVIQVGTVVLSPYKQKSAFYRGHVQAINPDGTLRIKYDDGDLDRSIPAHMVHIEASAPASELKPRSTTSIMNFLDQAKEDPKLSEALDLRRKLHSKIRSQKCRISHAKLVLRTLVIIEKISMESLKQSSVLADKGLKNVTDEMSNIANLVVQSASVVATSVKLACENLFKRKCMIAEDVHSIAAELERHSRVYGESAPKRKEDIEQRLKEVHVVMEKCDTSLQRIAASIYSFAEKRTSFPSGSGLTFFKSFESICDKFREIMGNISDSKMSAVIQACRTLSSVASRTCRKEEVEAAKQARENKIKINVAAAETDGGDNDIIEIDDDDDDDDDDEIVEIVPQKSTSFQSSEEVVFHDESEEQGCVVM